MTEFRHLVIAHEGSAANRPIRIYCDGKLLETIFATAAITFPNSPFDLESTSYSLVRHYRFWKILLPGYAAQQLYKRNADPSIYFSLSDFILFQYDQTFNYNFYRATFIFTDSQKKEGGSPI